jgi:23S rRNA-/tRNA-specific pseudouridylate synthase
MVTQYPLKPSCASEQKVLGSGKPPFVLHRLDMWTSGVVAYAKVVLTLGPL